MLPTPTSTFVLQAYQLSGGPGTQAIIQNLDFSWPAGVSWVGGDEGRGKTTLLRLLAGDLQPTHGAVHATRGGVFWADLQRPLHDELTPLACWDALRAIYPQWQEDLLQDLTDALSMRPHLHKRLNMLSTGSRRKVMLIAALSSGATVTLLDQPFVSLDAASIRFLLEFLAEASQHTRRAWLIADYEAPPGITLASVLEL